MRVIKNENVIFFDVDDTLVLWDREFNSPHYDTVAITDPYDSKTVHLRPHEPHIKLLKNHFSRGTVIVVWSQGGFSWAKAVIDALGLQKFVHLVMSKPKSYVDDLPVERWMNDRIFIKPDSNWGKEIKS